MTVQALIELLQRCDPHKEVRHVMNSIYKCGNCDSEEYSELEEVVDDVREEINKVIIYGE